MFGVHKNLCLREDQVTWGFVVKRLSMLSQSLKCQEWTWWPKGSLRMALGKSHPRPDSTSSIEYSDNCSKSSEHVGKPHDGPKSLSLILIQDSPTNVLVASQ